MTTTPEARSGMLTYSGDIMACPLCGDPDGTHVERVHIAARTDDAQFTNISVDAKTGQIDTSGVSVPLGEAVGLGRRHRIALEGWCEMCGGHYAIVFTQHKGATYVETVPM